MERSKLLLSSRLVAFNPVVALKVITSLAATLAIYHQDLCARNEATNQVLIVSPLLAYVIYRKGKVLRAVVSEEQTNGPKTTQHFTATIGMLLCITAMIVRARNPNQSAIISIWRY